jgi:hypothetical protein
VLNRISASLNSYADFSSKRKGFSSKQKKKIYFVLMRKAQEYKKGGQALGKKSKTAINVNFCF